MKKLVNTRTFGKITVKNYDYRPTLSEDEWTPFGKRKHYFKGWGEFTKIYVNGELKSVGNYTWINRSRQRFDFQTSMYHAVNNLDVSWSEYEAIRKDLQAVKEYVKD